MGVCYGHKKKKRKGGNAGLDVRKETKGKRTLEGRDYPRKLFLKPSASLRGGGGTTPNPSGPGGGHQVETMKSGKNISTGDLRGT